MFRTIQIIFGVLGILLALGGDKLSMPILTYGGIASFGFAAMAIGWEAIITREIKLGSRRRGTRETYTGIPAILQGIQFNLIGIFFIGISAFIYLGNGKDSGREIFLQFVRRPGMPLLAIGALLLLQSLVVFLGYRELNEGSGFMVTINLVISRMLPGVILLALGLGAMGLGLLDVVAPTVFDNLGGGFLEVLYGLR